MARRPLRRNLAARSPLLHKGGVHVESGSSKRHLLERQLEDALDDWFEALKEEEQLTEANGDRDG
jgi:hypothetical protein